MQEQRRQNGKRPFKMKTSDTWLVGLVTVIVLLFGAVVGALWKLGLFDFTGSDASAKIVASAIALVGGLIAALVSLVGVFLRQSVERRNADLKEQAENRLKIESERNDNLKTEAERRLKLEAAIRAVGMLSTSSGFDAPRTQKGAVLFALADLGQLDLAISLLRQMVVSDKIDMNSAVWLINDVLESGSEICQREATEILRYWPTKLLLANGLSLFPSSVDNIWMPQLSRDVRANIALGRLELIVARGYRDWNRGTLMSHAQTLFEIWKTDEAPNIKDCAGFCLSKMIRADPEIKELIISNYPEGAEAIGKMSHLRRDHLHHYSFASIADKFEVWAAAAGAGDSTAEPN